VSEILNSTVGRYAIKELIGEGAMAKVYRAYDPEINRSLAFKILKNDFCVDEEYLSRFLREAKAAGALSHPSIVTVYDVGKVDNSPYIMMELLKGGDLGELLAEQKKLSIRKTLIIGMQLAKALNYAHNAGIVHRDLKPDNIMVLEDRESIKVADFGIARINQNEEAQKTQVGSVLGTPRYMSPEQALGEEVDGRSDLFSIGVILYEMLTGVKAFDASNIGTLMTQITQKQPAPLQQLCPEIPAGLRQIVQKLLQKKPEKRFQTGDELATAIGKELAAFSQQEEEKGKHKYVPLKVRWSLYMGAIIALVMMVSMSVVFNIQSTTMTEQAVDSGASFAKFIAIETAIPLLSEDWITLETFVSDATSRKTFSYLIVTDRQGIVRGSSDLDKLGLMLDPAAEESELVTEKDGIKTTSSELSDGSRVFNITAPILFQDTEVGKIVLGLSQDSLDEVKSVTGWLMFSLAMVVILSVVLVLFVFGGLIAKPLKVVSSSLKSFAKGDLDTRISLTRNDEIGELFNSFNQMAAALQQSKSGEPDEGSLAAANENVADVGAAADNEDKAAKPQSNKKKVETDVVAVSPLLSASGMDVDASIDATVMASSQTNLKASKASSEAEAADKSVTEVPKQTNADDKMEGIADSGKSKKAPLSEHKTSVKGKSEAKPKEVEAGGATDEKAKPDEAATAESSVLTAIKPANDVEDVAINPSAATNKKSS
jgi:serine/threonine protein kinase/HAMP domain-containing protein